MEGKIKWFNTRKGFGFIAGDDGQDYFVHVKALVNLEEVKEGDRVKFEVVITEKGKQAQYVQLSV